MPFGESAGDFFKPTPGRYVAQFKGLHDAPQAGQTWPDGKPKKSVIWGFDLFNVDGTPVKDPKHAELPVARAEGMSSQSVGVGKDGRASKGRTWLTAVRASKGLPLGDVSTVENTMARVAEALDGFSYVTYTAQGEKVVLTEIEPAPALNGIGAATPAAVAPAAAVVAPVAAAVAPFAAAGAPATAPLAVPAPTPFVPSIGGADMATVPVMPFAPATA